MTTTVLGPSSHPTPRTKRHELNVDHGRSFSPIAEQIELERGRHAHAETMARIGRTERVLLASISGPLAKAARLTAALVLLHLLGIPGFDLHWLPL